MNYQAFTNDSLTMLANLILLHNFKVFALKIKRGTKARVSPASLKILEGWEPLRGDGVRA